jgi:hypothetical protein
MLHRIIHIVNVILFAMGQVLGRIPILNLIAEVSQLSFGDKLGVI